MSAGQLSKLIAKTILNRGDLAQVKVLTPDRTGIVSRISVWAEPVLTVTLEDQTADYPATVYLNATVESGTADTWEWQQTAGTPVTLAGAGANRSFKAPATTDGTVLVFRARATNTAAGQTTAWATATITVRAHGLWLYTDRGQWEPRTVTPL